MTDPRPRCLVVGGGIGGCCAALTLHRAGADVQLFEQAATVEPLGLAINLTPQVVKVLSELGLAADLEESAVQTSSIMLAGNHGLTIWSEPRGLAAGNDYPQYSIHRGRLAQLLYKAVYARLGSAAVHLGHEFVSIEQGTKEEDHCAVATFRVGSSEIAEFTGDVLIGCDGLASKVRKVFYNQRARFTGWICWRGCSEMDEVMDGATMEVIGDIQNPDTGAILSGKRSKSFVCYPMDPALIGSGRMSLNWVAEVTWDLEIQGDPGKEEYDQDASEGREKVLEHFAGWSANGYNVDDIVRHSSKILQFPMYDRDPVERWTFGRVTLLGDAAHPMLPFGSQGAGQAILDADSLGRCMAHAIGAAQDVRNALRAYESERLHLANAVVESTRTGGEHEAFDIVRTRLGGRTDIHVDNVKDEIQRARNTYAQTAGFKVAGMTEMVSRETLGGS